MKPLMTAEELESRLPPLSLPMVEDEPDVGRINLALQEATGIIVAHLPWLIDSETGEISQPVNVQFKDALLGICVDLALYRLTDRVSSHEDDRDRYNSNMKLLEKIDREYRGGLSGPDIQQSSIVIPGEEEEIPDLRFFKKGSL